jgi:hypothetical protein
MKKNFLSMISIAKATRTDRAALKMFHSKDIIQHLIGDVKRLAIESEDLNFQSSSDGRRAI